MQVGFRAALAAVLVLCAFGPQAGAARAAELVLYELPGCAWCAKWHREVGHLYDKTEEGKLLPLRQVHLGAPPRDLKKVAGIKAAPTFVVVECGKEIARIVGYQGDDMFWGELSAIVKKMKADGRPKARC